MKFKVTWEQISKGICESAGKDQCIFEGIPVVEECKCLNCRKCFQQFCDEISKEPLKEEIEGRLQKVDTLKIDFPRQSYGYNQALESLLSSKLLADDKEE